MTAEKLLMERIQKFLNICSPHMRERDWYKLLEEVLSTQQHDITTKQPEPEGAAPKSKLTGTVRAEALLKEREGMMLMVPREGMISDDQIRDISQNWANLIDQIARQRHSTSDYELEIRYAIKEALKLAAQEEKVLLARAFLSTPQPSAELEKDAERWRKFRAIDGNYIGQGIQGWTAEQRDEWIDTIGSEHE